jgi:glucan biosynthesis protein
VITEDDICNELLAHWAEQNKPHLDDEDKCCYALAVRAADEIRRLRAEVEALRAAIGALDVTGGGVCAAREVVKQFDVARKGE